MDADARIGGYIPGAIGRVAEMHAEYYHRHWNFGLFFEAKVASELSAFLTRFDEKRDGFWTVSSGSRVEGSIAVDALKAGPDGAHLRWFILSARLRGCGFGNRLLNEAVEFCRRKEYPGMYLWTFEGLDPARHLYEKFGFRLTEAHAGDQWGKKVHEQKFVLNLR